MEFSLIIPLWNEGKNVTPLVEGIASAKLVGAGMRELILVNNASTDETRENLDRLSARFPWITPVHLPTNVNYGGGVYEGFRFATTNIVSYIPGDLQVSPTDVLAVWKEFRTRSEDHLQGAGLFVKGNRTTRLDGFQTRLVSMVYTFLANRILNLGVKDLNGLPKMFHKSLLDYLPAERMKTFVFDAQLLAAARDRSFRIVEIPVTFHARREGISSWSGKRFRVYRESLRSMVKLRTLRNAAPVGFSPLTSEHITDTDQAVGGER